MNPPEVHDAALQFAGWGPRGQQLVRRLYPFETVRIEYWHTGGGSSVRISMASQISHMVCLSWTDKCCDQKSFMRIIRRDLRIPGQTLLYLTSF